MLKRIVSAALALLFCFSVSGITNKVSAEKKSNLLQLLSVIHLQIPKQAIFLTVRE